MKLKKLAVVLIVTMVVAELFFFFLSSGRLVAAGKFESSVSAPLDIGIYADSECTHGLTLIDWGQLSAGQSLETAFYVKNLGKFPVELSLTAINWNPVAANEVLNLGWNREGMELFPHQVTMATLTLTVSSEVNGITTFEFNTVVIGTKLHP